jgi:branched-chain amino acid aminotransferase
LEDGTLKEIFGAGTAAVVNPLLVSIKMCIRLPKIENSYAVQLKEIRNTLVIKRRHIWTVKV